MYKEHHSFHTPDKSLTIWRYIDFEKFTDLLLSRELFFARSDQFDDPFEGVLKLKDHEKLKAIIQYQIKTKKFYFLNCWHINEVQSTAMWKIFVDNKNGIAIKSTIGRLIKSFEATKDDVFISKIYYRDFEKVTFEELVWEDQNKVFNGSGSSINQFNYKRISFDHEKELRVYFIDMPIPHTIGGCEPREPLENKRISVSLSSLIDEIIISPYADDWFENVVKGLIDRLNFKFTISKSSLFYI